jgi:FkbM family methyltransferase
MCLNPIDMFRSASAFTALDRVGLAADRRGIRERGGIDIVNLLEKFRAKASRDGYAAAALASLRFVLRKLGVSAGLRPFEYVQLDVQQHLHRYLGVTPDQVWQIVIVGAHMGYEVIDMLRRFPKAKFVLFEASPRYAERLKNRFSRQSRVTVSNCAVARVDGVLTFFETNLDGSGSILKVGELAQSSYGMRQCEQYTVTASRLDSHARANGYDDRETDCLWVDVQGAELGVLEGAEETLKRTKAVFVEVSVFEPLYIGGAVLRDISNFLEPRGFRTVALGVDSSNGTGNALFARRTASN